MDRGDKALQFARETQDEHVFAEIVGAVELGLYVWQVDDPDDAGSLRLVYANPASVAATGIAVGEIVGRPVREAFPQLIGATILGIYLEIALGGKARDLGDVEYEDLRVPTQVFSVRAFPLPHRRVGVSFTNQTSQHAAEQRAVQTLESMSDAFFTLDSSWRFTYLNPQCDAILERPREALLGKSMWEEFPGAVGTIFDAAYRRALAEQAAVRVEAVYEPLGRNLEVRAHPIAGGLAVYFRDVTSDRRRDDRVREGQRLESIGRVTAGVAHDFNNLLMAVRGFADLGRAVSVDEKARHYFGQIESAGRKATELTQQLLAFGRRQKLTPASVDLNDVVGDCAPLLRRLLPAGIELRLALASRPVPVFVDVSQFERMLVNFVVNGRDAIETTGTITIATGTDCPIELPNDVRAPSAWLQVRDTGAGIPDDVRQHIFDPFFSTKPAERGTGLGLATIHGIVSQSGGDIFVDSTVGAGTTMTVTLPAHPPGGPLDAPADEAALSLAFR